MKKTTKKVELKTQRPSHAHSIGSNGQVSKLSPAEIEMIGGGGCPQNTCPVELNGGWLTCKPC